MTSILKSELSNGTKNGIILKEIIKKFEEATSTSGCDLEMSEITSSMPTSLSLNNLDTCSNMATNTEITIIADDNIAMDNINHVKVNEELTLEIEDVIDGFSVFSFVTEDDLIKFSIKCEKIEILSESENSKCKKNAKCKKKKKFNKATKDLSYNEDGIDIYDFQGNSESSPSSKNSSINLKKTINKKLSTKYLKKFKHKFKMESTLSPSEENSSSTSVTESHNTLLLGTDGRNESPRPTSNDDNNVVSTTTPDNVNIELEKLDLANSIDKIPSAGILSPLKTASLRLYKLEDELASSSHTVIASLNVENGANAITEQHMSAFYSGSDNVKVYTNPNQFTFDDENYQPKIVPTKFSVDLLTKITDKKSLVDESIKCLSNSTINVDWNITKKSPDLQANNNNNTIDNSLLTSSSATYKHIVFDTTAVTGATTTTPTTTNNNNNNNKMSSTAVKPMLGANNCCTSAPFRDGSHISKGAYHDGRVIVTNDNLITIDDDNNVVDQNISKSSANSPMQSWLELHTKGLLHQQHNALSHSNVQTNSNSATMPLKTVNCSSFNPLNSSCHNSHSVNNKSQHDTALLDWKNNYFESAKLLGNSVPKFNQNFSSLNHELSNNIRYQQEQQELMNALRIKHENSKIPKPLVNMGLDSMFKVDHSLYKTPESRFQTPSVHNYFMPNSQLPTEFNTANVFKTRSEHRCHQNPSDTTSSKDSFTKALPTLSSSNFKAPDNLKRRGQWCDMHVKIAYFISRSQRRMSMLKSQELNSQLSHLMYSQKLPPPTGPVPTASPYPAGYLQHSSPYLDYRSSQMKPDSSYLNYQPKASSNAFLPNPIRPMNPYHSIIPQGLEADLLSSGNIYDDHHQTPEQKWLRLLSQYMATHPLSSVERPNPEVLNQLYLWYQQLAQSTTTATTNPNAMPHYNAPAPSSVSMQASNLDANSAYLRKYMEHLSSCLGSMKADNGGYSNSNGMTERDMQLYLMKQQQYQKALMSKYQTPTLNKPTTMNHINPLLINSHNPFYNKKLMEMKAPNTESMLPPYSDCVSSLVNPKYRLTQEQMRQMKQDNSRNGFSKLTESSNNPKRRKLNSESLKTDVLQNGSDKEESKSIMDLTADYGNNVSHDKSAAKSRENTNFQQQTVIGPETKE